MIIQGISLLLALFFLYATLLQFNDPDPLYWIAVYAATGAVAVARGFKRYSRFWTAIIVGAVLAGLLIAAPGFLDYLTAGDLGILFQDMSVGKSIEAAREFIGLLIALAALLYFSRGSAQ